MKKIELDPLRSIIGMLIGSAIYALLKIDLRDSIQLFLLTSIIAVPIVYFCIRFRRSRKAGLYFSAKGVTYNNGFKIYFSPWSKVKAEAVINFSLYKEIKLTLSGSKTSGFGLVWFTEKDLFEAAPLIPKDHDVYLYIKKYADKRNISLI